jgi:hypothetical protein
VLTANRTVEVEQMLAEFESGAAPPLTTTTHLPTHPPTAIPDLHPRPPRCSACEVALMNPALPPSTRADPHRARTDEPYTGTDDTPRIKTHRTLLDGTIDSRIDTKIFY